MGKKHYICICTPIINIDSIPKINPIISRRAYSKHYMRRLRDYINNKTIDEDSDSDSDIDNPFDSYFNFFKY